MKRASATSLTAVIARYGHHALTAPVVSTDATELSLRTDAGDGQLR
jgi:hypothetical protein